MRTVSRILTTLAAVAVVAVLSISPMSAAPGDAAGLVNVDRDGVILDGYDTVAFFTDGKPVPGLASLRSTWQGAIYQFATPDHKKLFDANPSKYAPQFGAFCAYAVSQGRTAAIDVNTWSIVEGRLVVQHNAKAVKLWSADPTGLLHKADEYWPHVVKSGGKQIDVSQVR